MKFVEVVQEAAQKGAGIEATHSIGSNFPDILRLRAKESPEKTFLTSVERDRSYSYREFNGLVNSCARFLQKQKVKRGDVVLLSVRNSIEFLSIYFATMRLGAIINLVPSTVAEKELAAQIVYLKPKLACVEKDLQKKGVFKVEFDKKPFLRSLEAFSTEDPGIEINADAPSCLFYSSGTTAEPKGILFSQKGVLNMAHLLSREFSHSSKSVHFGILPMGHTSVMHHCLLPMLYVGGTFVFSENFMNVRKNFWKIIESYKINYVQTVPTILLMILSSVYTDYNKKKLALQFVACGSAPLPEQTKKDFERKFGLPIANMYGLSEAGHMIDDYPFDIPWTPGMIGRPMQDVDIRLLDEKGTEVKTAEVGEIAVKTPSLFMGYYKNEKLTKASMKGGYFCTGDLAFKDKAGIFYFADRKKDLIIKGGVNISPNLIDEVLLKDPAVDEAASVGKKDAFFGEVIKSFVVLRSGKKTSEKALIAFCKRKLGDFKAPSEIEFVNMIPKTFSGKILKRSLRK